MSQGSQSDVPTYGVVERLRAADRLDDVWTELKINGFAVIDSGLPDEFLGRLAKNLEEVYEIQKTEFLPYGDLTLTADADVARCLLSYRQEFLDLALCDVLMGLAERFLGSNFILVMQNGIINRPERPNYQSRYHRDLNYQHWVCSKPLAMNALFCIDDFTVENGATFVLQGTQHVSEFPSDCYVRSYEKQVIAPAGSFLVLDAMVYHRAGTNFSKFPRRAVNHVIGLPFIAQQVNIPSALSANRVVVPESESTLQYLGYRWAPADDVKSWREKHFLG